MKNRILKYGAMDIAKFFLSICVVAIHTHPFEGSSDQILLNIYSSIVSLAVPFFFLCSGFFMYSSEKNFKKNISKVLNKHIKLYLIWTIIYLPITIYGFMVRGESLFYSVFSFVRGFLFVGENQNSWILWYMLSSIIAIMIFKFCVFNLKKDVSFVFKLSILFFIINLLLPFVYQINTTSTIINITLKLLYLILPYGRILTGLFYISTGLMIAKYKSYFKNNYWTYLILFIIILIVNILLDINVINEIMIMVSSVLLFTFIINLDKINSKKTIVFRKLSTIIYFLHMLIFTLYSQFTANIFQLYGLHSFVLVLLITISFSFLILINKKNRILNYIFN